MARKSFGDDGSCSRDDEVDRRDQVARHSSRSIGLKRPLPDVELKDTQHPVA
jgi:hypothetical protein